MALGQGAFYLVMGIWPLLSIRTFMKVTGPKQDVWLVKTVGSLLAVVGAVLGLAGGRHRADEGDALLGAGSAATLTAVDAIYVAKRRISPIYLLDAVAELGIIAAWLLAYRRRSTARTGAASVPWRARGRQISS